MKNSLEHFHVFLLKNLISFWFLDVSIFTSQGLSSSLNTRDSVIYLVRPLQEGIPNNEHQ